MRMDCVSTCTRGFLKSNFFILREIEHLVNTFVSCSVNSLCLPSARPSLSLAPFSAHLFWRWQKEGRGSPGAVLGDGGALSEFSPEKDHKLTGLCQSNYPSAASGSVFARVFCFVLAAPCVIPCAIFFCLLFFLMTLSYGFLLSSNTIQPSLFSSFCRCRPQRRNGRRAQGSWGTWVRTRDRKSVV